MKSANPCYYDNKSINAPEARPRAGFFAPKSMWDEDEITDALGQHGWHIEDVDMIPAAPSSEDLALADEVIGQLYASIAKLRPQQAKIIALRWGLFGREFTQSEVAEVTGLTQGRISQIESEAMASLRNYLSE